MLTNEQVREARAAYAREWRKRNSERTREYERRRVRPEGWKPSEAALLKSQASRRAWQKLHSKEYQREWVKRNPEKVRMYQERRVRPKYSEELYAKTRGSRLKSAKKYRLRSKYGLSVERYLEMIDEQNGRCKICGCLFVDGYFPQIDHDHETNEIRGLLCIVCNTCLRAIDKDRQWGVKALAYLEKR